MSGAASRPAVGDSGSRADADAEPRLSFADNSLLVALFGPFNQHLARIEQKLGVTIQSRGNEVSIVGPRDASESAAAVLRSLYRELEAGHDVAMSEVDAAVRMAEGGMAEDTASRGGAEGPGAAEIAIQTRRRRIAARSAGQKVYLDALRQHELVFACGPAGTGKTYLAVAMAVESLLAGRVDRIILSRPAIEAGERLGFLPGDLRDKVDPYLRPLYDALYDMMPAEQVVRRLGNGEIEVAPLAFMRGRTLANAFVILDEAQNATPVQMKMFLTRLGENARMAVTGDLSQVDLPTGSRSGLDEALDILEDEPGIAVVRFTEADVVRHGLVTRIVRAYARREEQQEAGRNPKA